MENRVRNSILALIAAATLAISEAGAQTTKPNVSHRNQSDHKAVKLVDLWTCPMTDEVVKGAGGGSAIVGTYRVHFCCAGCKDDWARLPQADKQKAIARLVKKKQ